MNVKSGLPALLALVLAACSSAPNKPAGPDAGVRVQGRDAGAGGAEQANAGCTPYAPAQEDPSKRGNYTRGGLYLPGVKDRTPDHVPDVDCIPEPVVTNEPRAAYGNQSPYTVLGKRYTVMDDVRGYVETGIASYYGSKFHGRLTSSHEVYDVNAFTAAHKSLPLPSFALVTNLDNGKSVVVRVNDRGPFHDDRLIDLSYAAAVKLGITAKGTGRVQVRALTPADNDGILAARRQRQSPASRVAVAAKAEARSGMDGLVGVLPAKPAVAAAQPRRVATGERDAERWRYRVADQTRPGHADNFDAWMKARGVRVATGKPARLSSASDTVSRSRRSEAELPAAVASAPRQEAAAAASRAPIPATGTSGPTAVAEPSAVQSALGHLLLQVASFASHENANRALAQLASAGIVGARLSDIVSGGRTFWRLQVPANDQVAAAELSGRIARLGLGQPRLVRE